MMLHSQGCIEMVPALLLIIGVEGCSLFQPLIGGKITDNGGREFAPARLRPVLMAVESS